MGALRKKDAESSCNHKWKDFPWYYTTSYEKGKTYLRIFEPYICIFCKERKDVLLEEVADRGNHIYNLDFLKKVQRYVNQYSTNMAPRAEIEDAIHDLQLVDRRFLEAHEKLHNLQADYPKIESGN